MIPTVLTKTLSIGGCERVEREAEAKERAREAHVANDRRERLRLPLRVRPTANHRIVES